MSARAEVSKKNEYWVYKERYLELKHFCFQYNDWKMKLADLEGLAKVPNGVEKIGKTYNISNPTEKAAEAMEYFRNKIDLVKQAATEADESISEFLLIGVTQNVNYETLKVKYYIPCSKDYYYKAYRKFFWVLDQIKE